MTSLKRFGMLWLVAVAFSSFAQFVSVTPRLGGGIAPFRDHDVRKLFNVGLGTEFRLSDAYAIKAELFYQQERRKDVFEVLYPYPSPSNASGSVVQIIRYHFVALPISFQKNFGPGKNYFWGLGSYTAYLMAGERIYKEGRSKQVNRFNIQTSPWFWGASADVGMKIPVGERNKIVIALKSVYSRNDQQNYGAIWLLVGYEFGRKKS
jgi:hypothetical protein